MRFILLLAILFGVSLSAIASTDSLIIKGRILNLNGRLYRQAPSITFSRNNILQPQLELSKQADLAADGSFRVSLPMLYQQEEIYLDYGGLAYTTFLGSPGTIEITFDGDSIKKAKKLFYFAGENADANNQYFSFLNEENQRLTSNAALGSKFYENFWIKSAKEALDISTKRAELRVSALAKVAETEIVDENLRYWVKSTADDEKFQNLFEYALSNDYALGNDMLDSLNRLANAPLTAQRVTWGNRFGNYADRKVEAKKYSTPARANSLPVRLMAKLIKDNTSTLTSTDRARLEEISRNGLAEKSELDFINSQFAKNEMVLNLLFDYERESRLYDDLFDSTAREFLKARYLPRNFHKFTYNQQELLSRHIQSRLTISEFRKSLDEIVKIETKDSVDIKKLIAFRDAKPEPVEALPGYYFMVSNERGTSWLKRTLDIYKGRTIYLVKWNFGDPRSREELEYIGTLQAQLPADIVFLFVHIPDDSFMSGDLVKQYIIRHRLKGTHVFLNDGQTMDLLFKLNPIEPATFSVIRPNGKFHAKTAPPPSMVEKVVQSIREAENR